MSKIWKTPELTVLVRKKSDEFVLDWCKGSNGTESGRYGGCKVITSDGITGPDGSGNAWSCDYHHCSFTEL